MVDPNETHISIYSRNAVNSSILTYKVVIVENIFNGAKYKTN